MSTNSGINVGPNQAGLGLTKAVFLPSEVQTLHFTESNPDILETNGSNNGTKARDNNNFKEKIS